MRTPRLVAVAVALAAASCGHAKSGTVREGDLARLEPAQAAPVEASRGALAQAEEDLVAARARLPEARRELELADGDRKVADAPSHSQFVQLADEILGFDAQFLRQ